MALIACKSCGRMISDKATACPHCGYKPAADATTAATPAAPVETPATPAETSVAAVETTATPVETPVAPVETPATPVASEAKASAETVAPAPAPATPPAPKASKLLVALDIVLALVALFLGVVLLLPSPKASPSDAADSAAIDSTAIRDSLNAAAAAQQELDEFNNFSSPDLAAFLLHGKVKQIFSYSGQSYTKCVFDETGKLVKYETGDNHDSQGYEISHDGTTLGLVQEGTFGSWGESYEVSGKHLVSYEAGGDGVGDRIVYANYDEQGWPTTETHYDYDMMEDAWNVTGTTFVKYSDLDEHGNWLKKTTEDGEVVEQREIKYFPLGK